MNIDTTKITNATEACKVIDTLILITRISPENSIETITRIEQAMRRVASPSSIALAYILQSRLADYSANKGLHSSDLASLAIWASTIRISYL